MMSGNCYDPAGRQEMEAAFFFGGGEGGDMPFKR